MSALNHLLLGVAAIAVWGASFRLASTIVERGLLRILATMTFAGATIVVETMVLALPRLGGSQISLVLAAVLTWLVTAFLVSRPSTGIGEELSDWLERASTAAIVGVSAAIGVGVVWTGWSLWSPNVGVDGVYYHLPQIIRWIHEGAPGSVDHINYMFPVGSYPLTNAVAQAWGLGISRSMVMVSIWPIFNMTVLVLAGWVGLRRLEISIPMRVLAILAVLTTPVVLMQLGTPLNDLPTLSWLACGAALVVYSRDEPRLLIPGVIAIGLAMGTKTIALPLGIALLCLGIVWNRQRLRPIAGWLAISFGIFFVVGCFWYARTFIDHGSPFWPWSSTPWGDPVPDFLRRYESLLRYPRQTLEGRLDQYSTFIGGAGVLLLSAIALAAARADRRIRLMGALLVGLLLLWAAAPSTAKTTIPAWDGSVSQTRYLLPVIGFAAVLTCLASRRNRRLEPIGLSLISIVLVWNLGQLFTGTFPTTPGNSMIVAGALAGVAAGALIGVALRGQIRFPGPLIGAGMVAVLASLLAIPAASWVSHHGKHRANFDAGLARYLSARDDFRNGDEPIWMAPLLAGPLAGDRLQHNVKLIPARMPCPQVDRLRRTGWVIILEDRNWVDAVGYTVGGCLKREPPLAVIDEFRIYKPQPEVATG